MAVASVSSNKRKYIAGAFFLGGIITACVFLVYHWEYVVRFQRFGYLGIFLVTLASGGIRGNGPRYRGYPSLFDRSRREPVFAPF
jgi:hypothetical protein